MEDNRCVSVADEMDINLITFNVTADFLAPPGVPPWEERKLLCAEVLRQACPSILGLQEVMPRQFDFFQAHLPEFEAITVTETTTNETLLRPLRQRYGLPALQTFPTPYEVVLFFRTTDFLRIDAGYWWLSPTPETLSVGFGNVAPRVVVWTHLRHHVSGRELIVFNTHLDGSCTRPMVDLCRRQMAAFIQRDLPLIFMGDFNVSPDQEEYTMFVGDGWKDAHAVSDQSEEATFVDGRRIDHIFYRGAQLAPRRWTRLVSPDPYRRLSDHDPVFAQFRIE